MERMSTRSQCLELVMSAVRVAALVLSDFEPRSLPVVTLDGRLVGAARRECFAVLGAWLVHARDPARWRPSRA